MSSPERQSARISKITNYGFTRPWHRMLYSCTYRPMATVGIKGLKVCGSHFLLIRCHAPILPNVKCVCVLTSAWSCQIGATGHRRGSGVFLFWGDKKHDFFAAEKRDFFGAVRQIAPQVPTASRASWLVMDNVWAVSVVIRPCNKCLYTQRSLRGHEPGSCTLVCALCTTFHVENFAVDPQIHDRQIHTSACKSSAVKLK